MDCSWISRYPEEDERYVLCAISCILFILLYYYLYSLFFGFHAPVNISSIRIIETATNYEAIIGAIRLFDNVLSGNIKGDVVEISKKWLLILNHFVFERNENKYDAFIYNTWKVFLQKKNKITIEMWHLNNFITDLEFLGLIFGGRGLEMHKYEDDNNFYIPDDNDMTNILKLNVLNLFNNLQTIWITNVQYRDKYYSFSLYQLLLFVRVNKIEKVQISTFSVNSLSWLDYLWGNKSLSLIEEYKKKGYGIEYDGKRRIYIKLL